METLEEITNRQGFMETPDKRSLALHQEVGEKRIRRGTIYMERHSRGRRSNGSQDGNRSSLRLVRGAKAQASYCYRYVGEIQVDRKRYRCRSYNYDKVWRWLELMRDRFGEYPIIRSHIPRPRVRVSGSRL